MDNWRISCSPFLVILLQVALCWYRPLHSLVGLSLSVQVSMRLGCRYTWELPTSAFELELPQFPKARLILVLYSFPVLTGDPDPCDETLSLYWPCITRLEGRAFAITRVRVLSSFRNGTNHNALSDLREWTFEIAWARMFKNTWCWVNTEGDSTHLSRNFFWLKCQQVGIWCKHIWFGFCLGSKLILSNKQSRATLSVLDTCLIIVGLRPLIIILIMASLSSKIYNWDSPWEECVLVGT